MERQILKAINYLKYVSKTEVTISGIQRFSPLTKSPWEKLHAKFNKVPKLMANQNRKSCL